MHHFFVICKKGCLLLKQKIDFDRKRIFSYMLSASVVMYCAITLLFCVDATCNGGMFAGIDNEVLSLQIFRSGRNVNCYEICSLPTKGFTSNVLVNYYKNRKLQGSENAIWILRLSVGSIFMEMAFSKISKLYCVPQANRMI